MKEVQPTTEKEKKDYYRDRVEKSLETAKVNKARNGRRSVTTSFPPPTPEQQAFLDTHDMYGNPLPETTEVKESKEPFGIKIERRL